jgi:hypothetical protein
MATNVRDVGEGSPATSTLLVWNWLPANCEGSEAAPENVETGSPSKFASVSMNASVSGLVEGCGSVAAPPWTSPTIADPPTHATVTRTETAKARNMDRN